MALREYKRRRDATVFAIQFAFETEGFEYFKWGAKQRCKAGDWIVRNGDDTYTVDAGVFARTYEPAGGVEYRKVSVVWAERQTSEGKIQTLEGSTDYSAGDYLVYNDREQTDGYAVERAKFEKMYEPA